MVKLADIDSEIRIGGKVVGAALAGIALLFVLFVGGQFIKNVFFPAPVAPPAEKFGTLAIIPFPEQEEKNLTYTVNTLTGTLDELPGRMKVYKIKRPATSLVALANARNILSNAGYTLAETKINNEVYQWTNPDGTTIQYNINNNDFKVTSNFINEPPEVGVGGSATTKEGSYQTAIDFLQSINGDVSNLDPEKSKITYLKIQDGDLVGAASQDDSQFVRIDLFPKDLDKHSVYFPNPSESPMYFILKNNGSNALIVAASYSNPLPGESSEYPTKTVAQAYQQLKTGNAYVIYTGKSNNIDITEVAQGYYVGPDQEYLLPIIVFSGSGFTAYVNALTSQ